tara:strand:- start:535 stop:714 length:180 start_codon:yes stop_codon:yes gene_type:complete
MRIITKEMFLEYEKIRKSGKYNMFNPEARKLTTMSIKEWQTIMKDYDKLSKSWLKGEKQ